jgi:SPX domain protein involved in polyphosphate accumulation
MNRNKRILMDRNRRPTLRSFFTNLHVNMPWPKKIRLLVRNNWIKIRNFQSCCGHPGEPGC